MKKTIRLRTSDHTSQLAQAFAPIMTAGSVVLLHGVVGAGKTHFARQLILTRLAQIGATEDVPSPTFTLVQTYDVGVLEIWHADLYRLSDVTEVYELGLEAAFDNAICLVEWPDRLGELVPENALSITFETLADNERRATLQWTSKPWTPIVERALQAFEYDNT